jgi:hypothetical protein
LVSTQNHSWALWYTCIIFRPNRANTTGQSHELHTFLLVFRSCSSSNLENIFRSFFSRQKKLENAFRNIYSRVKMETLEVEREKFNAKYPGSIYPNNMTCFSHLVSLGYCKLSQPDLFNPRGIPLHYYLNILT